MLPTLARLDLTYYEWSVLADEQMAALEASIHRVLFAEHEFDYGRHADALGLARDGELEPGWRNRRCDVLAMWSHVHYRADAFVTSDANFHRPIKRAALLELGANAICTPEAAVGLFAQ